MVEIMAHVNADVVAERGPSERPVLIRSPHVAATIGTEEPARDAPLVGMKAAVDRQQAAAGLEPTVNTPHQAYGLIIIEVVK